MKNKNLESHNKRNSLGMNRQVYKLLLSKLENLGSQDPDKPIQRIHTRLQYLDPYFELVLDSIDGTSRRKIIVASRNISRGGMSVLHSNFIYPGTIIHANLRRIDGGQTLIHGKICRCTHRGGVVHEIGMIFDQEIVVQEYIRPDIYEAIRSLEKVEPSQLEGKVLFIGADHSLTPFIREYLLETNINYGFVDTAQQALDQQISDNDLLFVSFDAGDMSGSEFIRCVRDSGYLKPIIICGRSDNEQHKQQIKFSSADMFLPTPISESALLCALGEYLITQWSEKTLETIRNNVDDDTVSELHDELFELATTLDSQLQAKDSVEVYITCTKIQSISTLLGMKSLQSLTFKVCENIAQSGDMEHYSNELFGINQICKNAKSAS